MVNLYSKAWKEDRRYAYAVGRTRALETKLLDKDILGRVLETREAESSLAILKERDYLQELAGLEDIHDFEEGLNRELLKLYDLLKEISPQPELIELFQVKYDFHNLKVFLKTSLPSLSEAERGKKEEGELPLITLGLVEPEIMEKAIKEEDYRNLPPGYQEAIEKTKERFLETKEDSQEIDLVLDRELYSLLWEKAATSRNEFLKEFFQIQIDLFNLNIWARMRRLKKGKEFLAKVLLNKGSLEKSLFLDLYEESPLPKEAEETLRNKLTYPSLSSYLEESKYVTFGLSPLISYLITKERETKLLRFIILGKLNGLPLEDIREKLEDLKRSPKATDLNA
jgi:V/A-type H+-transporting ATPase subunit C